MRVSVPVCITLGLIGSIQFLVCARPSKSELHAHRHTVLHVIIVACLQVQLQEADASALHAAHHKDRAAKQVTYDRLRRLRDLYTQGPTSCQA